MARSERQLIENLPGFRHLRVGAKVCLSALARCAHAARLHHTAQRRIVPAIPSRAKRHQAPQPTQPTVLHPRGIFRRHRARSFAAMVAARLVVALCCMGSALGFRAPAVPVLSLRRPRAVLSMSDAGELPPEVREDQLRELALPHAPCSNECRCMMRQ